MESNTSEEQKNLQEKIDKVRKDVKNIQEMDVLSDLIKNNEIEFDNKGIRYRVRKPTFQHKLKANEERGRRYIALLKDKNYCLERDLIEIYKTRGIDIDEMDRRYQNLEHERKDLLNKLGEALTKSKPKEELDVFRKEIEKINTDQQEIMIRKSVLLDTSIEAQINVFVYTYLSYLITERFYPGTEPSADKWEKAWNSYEEFLAEDEVLVNLVVWNATLLTRSEIPLI